MMLRSPVNLLDWASSAVARAIGPHASVLSIQPLLGQASSRKYYRLSLSGSQPSTAIVVELPDNPFASDESNHQQAVRQLPFCNVLHFLQKLGIPVPRLLDDGTAQGFLLLEDVGTETMLDLMTRQPDLRDELYRQAIDLLVQFQTLTSPLNRSIQPADCVGYSRSFDRTLLRWELDHFREWGLEAQGIQLSPAQRSQMDTCFDEVVDQLLALPQLLVHRDFQSTNLMPHQGKLVLIDFQDALLGPAPYDLVALLRDSYVTLSPKDIDHYIDYYLSHPSLQLSLSPDQFSTAFHLQTVQRKLKDAGRFVFIDRVKGNPRYLQYVHPTLLFVDNALRHLPQYHTLRSILAEHMPEFRD